MTSKYFAIAALGFSAAMVCAALGYGFSGIWRSATPPASDGRVAASVMVMPSDAQVKAVDKLMPRLAILATPTGKPSKALPLSLFGDRIDGQSVASVKPAEKPRDMDYTLSLTLLSGKNRFCVIDGIFLAEGDQLSDGAAVRKIRNRRVLIARHDKTKWISLNDPDDPFAPQTTDQTQVGKDQS